MEEKKLTEKEKHELLRIARETVSSHLKGENVEASSPLAGLQRKGGAFVTIHKSGALRGCIGQFESDQPLYKTIAAMAISAAFKDPRFSQLMPDELEDVDFEISVLSPLKEINDKKEIKVGTHGVYITKGLSRGVLLPQVATEQGWDVETFLSHTCMKAGLPMDEWQRGVKIEIFSAEVFGEKEDRF